MHAHDKLPQSDIHSLRLYSPPNGNPTDQLLAFSNNVRKERQRGKERREEREGREQEMGWGASAAVLRQDSIFQTIGPA